jgi:hypothetical protein
LNSQYGIIAAMIVAVKVGGRSSAVTRAALLLHPGGMSPDFKRARRAPPIATNPAGNISSAGLPPFDGGAGAVIQDFTPRGFWARIYPRVDAVAGTNVYGFAECDDGLLAPTGGSKAFPVVSLAGDSGALVAAERRGNGVSLAAYEVNGSTTVPIDGSVVVWLEPLLATPGYGFTYAPAPTVSRTNFIPLGGASLSVDDVWTNAGAVGLPGAGTYLITVTISGYGLVSDLGLVPSAIPPRVKARLLIDGGQIDDTEVFVAQPQVAGIGAFGSVTITRHVVVAEGAPGIVTIQGQRTGGTGIVWSAADLRGQNTGSGNSYSLTHVKLS